MKIKTIKEKDFVDCVKIVKKTWPEFKERESIYHLFSKYFCDTSFVIKRKFKRKFKVVSFLLGFLSQVDSSTAYIHLASTDLKYQREGYASALYQHFFKIVRAKGRKKICLIVNPDNESSLIFHKKLGFNVVNRKPIKKIKNVKASRDYNGPGIHMVVFSKDLTKNG
jgi:ribosomal protein S18 acetylase RimI-like enzyme